MFVGDQIDSDVVGGNRLGMVKVHITSGQYDANIDAFGMARSRSPTIG
jgi:ribonucleotide monophosphatase NagD (HAD superfamily)